MVGVAVGDGTSVGIGLSGFALWGFFLLSVLATGLGFADLRAAGTDTEAVLRDWGQRRLGRIDVICPGFVADCLETLEEIAIGGRHTFQSAGGGEFRYIACLNDSPFWLDALAGLVRARLGLPHE